MVVLVRLASSIFPAGTREGLTSAARRGRSSEANGAPSGPGGTAASPGPPAGGPRAPSHPLVHSAAVRGIPNVRHDPPSSSAVWVAIILVFSVEEGLPLPLRRLARSGAACSLALPSAARLGTRR